MISDVYNGQRPLLYFFLVSKPADTYGSDDDDASSRQLSLKLEVHKYLITRNVRHTHSLLVPDEQSMLRISLNILNGCEQHVSFPAYNEEKFHRKRDERGKEREGGKALRKQSQIRRTCFEVTTTSKRRKDYH